MSEDERGINNSPWIDCFYFLVIKRQKVTLSQFFGRNFPFLYFKKIHQIYFPPFFFLYLGRMASIIISVELAKVLRSVMKESHPDCKL
jgi:hypothetical protein